MTGVEKVFIYWPGRHNLVLGRKHQQNYQPGKPLGCIQPGHLDRVHLEMQQSLMCSNVALCRPRHVAIHITSSMQQSINSKMQIYNSRKDSIKLYKVSVTKLFKSFVLNIFFGTTNVIPRRILVPLNRYGCPNIEPKFFKTRFVRRPKTTLGNAL